MKAKPALMLMVATSIFISACHSPQVDDLEALIAALQSNTAPAPAALAELAEFTQRLTQVQYYGEQHRNPFAADRTQLERDSNRRLACELPDLPLRHHRLENFALDQLTFIGTLSTANRSDIALVISADGLLQRVAEGDYIGASYGRVRALERQKLTIREWLRSADGCWQQRDVELHLSLSPGSS